MNAVRLLAEAASVGMTVQLEPDGRVRLAGRRPEQSWRNIFTGVDLAINKADSAHDTAFFTGASEDRTKHVLELRRGKIEGPDIIRNMIDIVRRYPMHLGFRVETNQGQKFIQHFAEEQGLLEALGATPEEADRIRVYPQWTGANKASESVGVRAMNIEFERRRWPIPCDSDMGSCDLVQEWMDGLRSFDPVNHADDMVMASWLFWEQTRDFGVSGDTWSRFGIYVP